jgi:hypothetical protein
MFSRQESVSEGVSSQNTKSFQATEMKEAANWGGLIGTVLFFDALDLGQEDPHGGHVKLFAG